MTSHTDRRNVKLVEEKNKVKSKIVQKILLYLCNIYVRRNSLNC